MTPMGSRSSTPTAKSSSGGAGRPSSLYASPLARNRSYVDLTGADSPHAPRYPSRPQSPPTSSPPSEAQEEQQQQHLPHSQSTHLRLTARHSFFNDSRGRRYETQSPSIRYRELERGRRMERRERSPLPRLLCHDSSSSAAAGSHDSAAYSQHHKRPPSPRLLRDRGSLGDGAAMSFDSEQLRPSTRQDVEGLLQRSNSTEGAPFKRWGPFTSPIPIHRQQKMSLESSLSKTSKEGASDGMEEDLHSSPSLPPKQKRTGSISTQHDHTKEQRGEMSFEEADYGQTGSKRKHREEESGERSAAAHSDVSVSHSHFSSLAPPSSHLYGDMDGSRREVIGSATSAEGPLTLSAKVGSFAQRQGMVVQQEQDELEDEEEGEGMQESGTASRNTGEGGVLLVPQRKSCDRCFKMKTKCSRAAPGASGEGPCDGCVRRGFGEDCVTSRPDFPYPRISLAKRPRRESSLPALLNLNTNDSAVFVPPSMMQRSNDWRTKLIVNSLQRGDEGQGQSGPSIHHSPAPVGQTVATRQMSMGRSSAVAPAPLLSSQPVNPTDGGGEHVPPKAGARHVSHLRALPTNELRDLSVFIAHEVNQRSQPTVKTPTVPSASFPRHHHHHHPPQQQLTQPALLASTLPPAPPQPQQQLLAPASRNAPPPLAGLGQQAMQNAPMQLLPKAIGLPALDYFDQLLSPLLALPALSATVLGERYERYAKPGRNNVLELAMAIGLQFQGILLSCPDESQVNTAEGRIFKVFLQASKQPQPQPPQPQQQSSSSSLPPSSAQGQQQDKGSSDARLSIDSIKGWIEPGRHRSRAKEIVKHVMLRRCLKNGLDWDDVLENILLAYFNLTRGDVGAFHLYTGSAQRQVCLLDNQQLGRDTQWKDEEIKTLRVKVACMERLHPVNFFASIGSTSPPFPSLDSGQELEVHEHVSMQSKLGDIAAFVQTAAAGQTDSVELGAEVDRQLGAFRQRLPMHLQECIRNDWMNSRTGTTTPSLRLSICLSICFLRLGARQSCLIQAIKADEAGQGGSSSSQVVDASILATTTSANDEEKMWVCVRETHQIASTILSSTLLAFTVFPHLACVCQVYATELTASAWSFVISHLLLQSSPLHMHEDKSGVIKMEESLVQLVNLVETSQERESWPFAASLRMVLTIFKGAKEHENGSNEWLSIVRLFSSADRQGFARLLMGDAWAVNELRKERALGEEQR